MKKFLSVCIGLLLCLMLTACGGSKGEELESDIIVHVEVNPSFDIYVNDDGTIKSVDCLNDDAQTVYAEMDLTGVAYEDGFKQLLTAIHEAGFLKDDAKITVEIKQKSSVTFEVTEVTDEIVEDFNTNVVQVETEVKNEVVKEENNIPFSGLNAHMEARQNCTWQIDMHIDEDFAVDFQIYLDESQIITYVSCKGNTAKKIDEKANISGKNIKDGLVSILDVGFSLGIFSEGCSISVEAMKEPEAGSLYTILNEGAADYMFTSGNYFNFAHVLEAEEAQQFSGDFSYVMKESEGCLWKWMETFQNGVCVSRKGISSDGSIDEATFSADDGQLLYSYYKQADGSGCESKYAENGEMTYQLLMYEDGTSCELFFENGEKVKLIERYSSGVETRTFKNGKQRTQSFEGVDGSWYEIILDEDGNVIEMTSSE